MGGFAAELLGFELGGEAVEGGFVFLAEFGGAFVEAGLAGVFRFEEGKGEAGGGGDVRGSGVVVFPADGGDLGICDDALPRFEPAEEPGFLGDAEDEEFFGGGRGLIGADVVVQEGFEAFGAFVLMEEMGAEPGLA